MNLPQLVRDLAAAYGIPEALVPAVEHRAQMGVRAVAAWRDAARWHSGRARLDVAELAARVVSRSAADYRAGCLERRCAEPPVLRLYGEEG